MKKKRIIIIISILLVFVLIGIFAYSRDNIRFKLSYEMINNTEYNNGKKIKVNIPLNNPIKYTSNKKLLSLLKSGTGVIYFGYNTCPWCRNAVPILIESAKENDLDTIYYVDVHKNDIDSIEKELYKILDEYLKEYEDGSKKLAVPDVYVVKKGKIVGHHRGTVDSYKNPYKSMTKKQKQELKEIYNELIKEIK